MRTWKVLALVAIVGTGTFFAGTRFSVRPVEMPSSRKVLRYVCPMHPQYTSDRPGDAPCCGMRLVPVYEGEPLRGNTAKGSRLRVGSVPVSPEMQQIVGIRVGEAVLKPMPRVLRTVGQVAADDTRVYRITAATPGWIEQAFPNSVGTLVRKDERLATFYAREFLGAQQAFLYALDAKDRFVAQGAKEAQMASTNTQVQSATDTLLALGMSRSQIEQLAQTRDRVNTIDIRSPATGFVLTRNVSPGQRFDSGEELYVLGDLRRVWVLADLFEHDAFEVKPGRAVSFKHRGETFSARVANVLPAFNPDARTMKVRLEVDNPKYRLRPGMFVDVEFPIELPPGVVVPASAVIDSGVRQTVFVDRGNGVFEPRTVQIGWRFDDQVQIRDGLSAGERIVVSGTFLMDSESRIRAAAAGVYGPASTDPVCGMDVDESRARAAKRVSEHEGKTFYFCNDDCKRQFDRNPRKFIH